MFGAIGRWFKALSYLLTGQVDSARRTLDQNPHVVRAKYDAIVREKVARIQTYKQAVAGLIAQQETKLATLKRLTDDVQNLERLRAGALAKAKQMVEKLKAAGKTDEQIKADEEYKRCLAAYNDFSTTLAEKQDHIVDNERDVESYRKTIGDHKVQLQQLLRDVEKIKEEAYGAVADIITAKQEKDIADMLAGIAQDGTAQELQNLRQMRQELKAEARISKELAGTDTKAQEAEFLEYARQSQSNTEFDSLVGLGAKATETKPTEKEKAAGLPE